MQSFLPDLINYIKLSRPFTCLSSVVTVVMGGIYVSHELSSRILWAGISAVLLVAAGNMFNDVTDIESDKINHPERILPRKKLPVKKVFQVSVLLAVIANVMAGFINLPTLIISLVATLLLAFYTTHLKYMILLGNFSIGVLSGLLFIYGSIAVSPSSDLPYMLFLITVAGITARELLKTIADYPGDLAKDVKTTATELGISKSVFLYKILLSLFLLFSLLPGVDFRHSLGYFLIMIVTVYPIIFYTFFRISNDTPLELMRFILRLQKYAFLAWLAGIYLYMNSI